MRVRMETVERQVLADRFWHVVYGQMLWEAAGKSLRFVDADELDGSPQSASLNRDEDKFHRELQTLASEIASDAASRFAKVCELRLAELRATAVLSTS